MNKIDNRKNNGGLPGVGRKKVLDKKINVSFYVLQSVIENLGDKATVRNIAETAVQKELKKKSKKDLAFKN